MTITLYWWYAPIVIMGFTILFYFFWPRYDGWIPDPLPAIVLFFGIILTIGILIGHLL